MNIPNLSGHYYISPMCSESIIIQYERGVLYCLHNQTLNVR